jgi:hypothetical protein
MKFEPAFLQRHPLGSIVAALLLAASASAHGQTPQAPPQASGQAPDSQTLEQRQFKLPAALAGQMQQLEQKAAEEALGKILDNELPLKLDATSIYPTVSTLPGGPFNPKALALSAEGAKAPLPPGDYAVPALAFCTEYSVHQPGAGTAYVLAPLQGKAATAISTLLWRGTLEKHLDPRQLQAVSWAIQSGLTYAQMPKPYQAIIDSVIPEYKGQLNGNFLQQLQETYQAAAKTTKLPPLEQILGGLGRAGQLALSAMHQQQVLLRQDTTDQLREQTLFRGQESGVYRPVKAEEGPWTVRIPNVAYVRFRVVGGNMASNNVLEIRILPPGRAAPKSQRAARLVGSGLVRVAYTAQQLPPAYGRESPPDVIAPSPDLYDLTFNTIGQALGRGAQSLIGLLALENPCHLDALSWASAEAKNLVGSCGCPMTQWNVCPNPSNTLNPVPGTQRDQPPLITPYMQVFTNWCAGKKTNGILFAPRLRPNSSKQCTDPSQMHFWQFVNTVPLGNATNPPPPPQSMGSYQSGSCKGVSRIFGVWYLDACPGSDDGRLGPEALDVNINQNGYITKVLSGDESTPYTNTLAPAQKTFYDVLMCGDQLLDAFTYEETGVDSPPPACDGKVTAGTYSDLHQVPLNDPGLRTAACTGIETLVSPKPKNMTNLDAISRNLNCAPAAP